MSEVLYKYIGNGGFVNGIPARDILASETEHHATVKANMKNSSQPCWEEAKPAKQGKAKESE